ncbi:long-chain-fatty-acid--CoA ligase [Sulfodiicoccus acidiphilus]|uniref:Long-chain-fatty-acid--CoA ligase n=1 Tax=Sulfodiicoccus acidiphilus TaxID=1670455 RepID=A0A348B3N4_9CREN|nr:long-chain-fatty-acid--CoA ligase [Sulfodiicoccus acidiphilus]BBD72786.1 long-chain-fatty-acid--CoA ligase [Sulfodiicoccus acidiphilus]GGT99801.1 long-chain-fatty-acid--CoA ligase [Sulfodiicoccus acidiphilus]
MSNPVSTQDLTIKDILEFGATAWSETEIVYKNERVTFSQFKERVSWLAMGLTELGVRQGDVVAVIDWDTMRYMEAMFAVPMMGATLHTVNVRYPPEVVLYTMKHADDSYVIVRDEFLPLIEKFKDAFSFVKGWIVYSESGNRPNSALPNVRYYDDLLIKTHFDFPELGEESVAMVFYTSGTTGMPKGVWFTHKQIALHTMVLTAVGRLPPLNVNPDDVFMILVPLFHIHSWDYPQTVMLSGNKYVLSGKYDVENILELIRKEKVTYTATVPTVLYMILNHPRIREYAEYLRGWRVVMGGAAIPRGLALKAKEFGITVASGYGMSETHGPVTVAFFSDRVSQMNENARLNYALTGGRPLPMVRIKVVDTEGRELPHDGRSVGEIVVRAPWLTEGYLKDPERTSKLWRNGWLHTGDLGVIDEFGYVTFMDREGDAIKSGGEFISTLILESVISECHKVGEVAVVGVKDEKWGQRPVAFIVKAGTLEEGDIGSCLEDAVKQGKIQRWWIPDKFLFVEALPKTSTNKVDKKELRKLI